MMHSLLLKRSLRQVARAGMRDDARARHHPLSVGVVLVAGWCFSFGSLDAGSEAGPPMGSATTGVVTPTGTDRYRLWSVRAGTKVPMVTATTIAWRTGPCDGLLALPEVPGPFSDEPRLPSPAPDGCWLDGDARDAPAVDQAVARPQTSGAKIHRYHPPRSDKHEHLVSRMIDLPTLGNAFLPDHMTTFSKSSDSGGM